MEAIEVIHHHCKIVKRSAGRSAVAAAAYRAGERLLNEYDGVVHDYTRRRGVVFTDILLPGHAPGAFYDRETMWNSVEKIEKASNSQLARDVEFSLPNNLDRAAHIRMVREHVMEQFVKHGMCADVAIHDKGDGNPHAHILLTMRPLDENGEWGLKSKREYILDKRGERIPLKSGDFKTRKISLTDWDDHGNAERWHSAWALVCNRELERQGLERRVTNQSYADQGVLLEPTKHLGKAANQMEKRGERSERGDINREIKRRNAEIVKTREEIIELERLERTEREIEKPDGQKKTMQPPQERTVLYTAPSRENQPDRVQEQVAASAAVRPLEPAGRADLPLSEARQTQPSDAPAQPPFEHKIWEAAPLKAPETASAALSLDDIRQEYVTLELEIRRQRRMAAQLREEIRRVCAQREDLTESVRNIHDFGEEIATRQRQRNSLSISAADTRKRLDASLAKLEISRQQAIGYLRKEHGVEDMGRLEDKFAAVDKKQAGVERELAALTDTKRLTERQRALEEDYKREHAKTGQRQGESEGREKEAVHAPGMSLADRAAAKEAENRLNELVEHSREHSRDKDRERRR